MTVTRRLTLTRTWTDIVGVSTSDPQPSGTPLMSRTTSKDFKFFVSARNVGICDWNSCASASVSARMYTVERASVRQSQWRAITRSDANRGGSGGCYTTQQAHEPTSRQRRRDQSSARPEGTRTPCPTVPTITVSIEEYLITTEHLRRWGTLRA